jgi:hypothetical protein
MNNSIIINNRKLLCNSIIELILSYYPGRPPIYLNNKPGRFIEFAYVQERIFNNIFKILSYWNGRNVNIFDKKIQLIN